MNQYPSHGTKITQQPGQPMTADQYAALQALQNQRRVTSWPYYSTVKFHALASDDPIDGPVTYDVARGTEVKTEDLGVPNDSACFLTLGHRRPHTSAVERVLSVVSR